MDRRGALRRGVRVGMLMAAVPGMPWLTFLLTGDVFLLAKGHMKDAVRLLLFSGLLLGGSLAAGLLMGLIIGGGLGLVSRILTRARAIVVVGGLLAALAFVPEAAVIGVGTFASPLSALTIMLAWPVMTVVAAVHSPDVAGVSRKCAWLWTPGSSWWRSWWN